MYSFSKVFGDSVYYTVFTVTVLIGKVYFSLLKNSSFHLKIDRPMCDRSYDSDIYYSIQAPREFKVCKSSTAKVTWDGDICLTNIEGYIAHFD